MPALDGLRGLAIAAVVIQHVIIKDAGWWIGVDLFFVLSGFLITSTLLGSWEQHGSLRLRTFAWRRFRRLAPAMVAVLGAWTAWVVATGNEVGEHFRFLGVVLTQQVNVVGATGGEIKPELGHLWSLSAEIQFYVVWPLVLAFLLWRGISRGALVVSVMGLALASALLRFGLSFTDAPWYRIYLGPDTRLDALLLGAVVAMLVTWGGFDRSPRLARHIGALALPALLALGFVAAEGNVLTTFPWRGGLLLAVLSSTVLVAGCTAGTARFVLPVLETLPLQVLGRLSYSLYLWHLPVAVEFERLAPGLSNPMRWTLAIGVSLVLAFVTLAVVELPALQTRRRQVTRAAVVRPQFATASATAA